MQSNNHLSIIVPCFNSSAFLERCLLMIASQLKSGDELIVIDDGSSDQTVEQAYKFTSQVIINPQNEGPGYCRNRGALIAKNQALVYIDSDVEIQQGHLDFLREKLYQSPGMIISCTVDNSPKRNFSSDYKNLYLSFTFRKAILKNQQFLYGSLVAIHKDSWVSWPERTRYLEDALLNSYLMERNKKVFIPLTYPIRHHKHYTWGSLLKYDYLMGLYYTVFKLTHHQKTHSTHVQIEQYLSLVASILLLPSLLLSLNFTLFLTLLIVICNLKLIFFCCQQRGTTFAFKSFWQILLSYQAYSLGCLFGLLKFNQYKKKFI